MTALPVALSLSNTFTKIGAIAAFAALAGIAILALLVFSQARELKRLREWAGRAPERSAELEQRVTAGAAARVQQASPPVPPVRQVPRATPVVARPVAAATAAGPATRVVASPTTPPAGEPPQAVPGAPGQACHRRRLRAQAGGPGALTGRPPAVPGQATPRRPGSTGWERPRRAAGPTAAQRAGQTTPSALAVAATPSPAAVPVEPPAARSATGAIAPATRRGTRPRERCRPGRSPRAIREDAAAHEGSDAPRAQSQSPDSPQAAAGTTPQGEAPAPDRGRSRHRGRRCGRACGRAGDRDSARADATRRRRSLLACLTRHPGEPSRRRASAESLHLASARPHGSATKLRRRGGRPGTHRRGGPTGGAPERRVARAALGPIGCERPQGAPLARARDDADPRRGDRRGGGDRARAQLARRRQIQRAGLV